MDVGINPQGLGHRDFPRGTLLGHELLLHACTGATEGDCSDPSTNEDQCFNDWRMRRALGERAWWGNLECGPFLSGSIFSR